MLPADTEEHNRLDLQHTMLTMALGSLYWPPELVNKLLQPRPDSDDQPAIIDIGTGSGTWSVHHFSLFFVQARTQLILSTLLN